MKEQKSMNFAPMLPKKTNVIQLKVFSTFSASLETLTSYNEFSIQFMRLTSDGRSEWSDNPRIPNSDADKMMKMFALYHKNLFRFISHTIIHNLTHFFWLFRFDRSTHAHATVIHFTSISRLQSIMLLLTHSTHIYGSGRRATNRELNGGQFNNDFSQWISCPTE